MKAKAFHSKPYFRNALAFRYSFHNIVKFDHRPEQECMIALVTKVTSFVTRRRKSHEDEGDNIVNTNGHSDDRRLSKPGNIFFKVKKGLFIVHTSEILFITMTMV